MEDSVRRLLCHILQLLLQTLCLFQHGAEMLVKLAPRCVPPPHQTARGLAVSGERGRAPQGVLPAAARLLLLLQVLRAALVEPAELLQEGGDLSSQLLASAHPTLQGVLRGEGAAWTLILTLEVNLDTLNAVC